MTVAGEATQPSRTGNGVLVSLVRFLRRVAGGLLIAAMILGGVELLVRLLPLENEHRQTGLTALHEQVNGAHRAFVEVEPGWYETNPEFLQPGRVIAEHQRFAQVKPKGTFRIFCLGESSVAAWPFEPRSGTSFSSQLGKILGTQYSDIEVINAGRSAATSTDIRFILQELMELQPDLFILYFGHNDSGYYYWTRQTLAESPVIYRAARFFEKSATFRLLYRLSGRSMSIDPFHASTNTGLPQESAWTRNNPKDAVEASKAFENRIPSAEWERFVRNELFLSEQVFLDNLRRMNEIALKHHVPIVIGTLVSNLQSRPVFSYHSAGLSPDDLERWSRLEAAAKATPNPEGAIPLLEEMLEIDDHYAATHFDLYRAYAAAGRWDKAHEHAVLARDWAPSYAPSQRAPSSLNVTIREEAKQLGLSLVDFEHRFFSMESNHGIPGDDLFLDTLHPNAAAHRLMAETLAQHLVKSGLVPLTPKSAAGATP